MATSEARIAANRENALKSTGPKTQEGKDRSRANALKHGLCSTVLVPEDRALVQARSDEWFYALKPQNPHQTWLVDQISVASLRIDRAERMERRLRDRAMLRAEIAWDDDRRIEVENLGCRIQKRPSEIVRQLRATRQGCDWLLERWAFLARDAHEKGSWTPSQVRLAFDLLGTPEEAREGRQPGDLLDVDGNVIEPGGNPETVARRAISALKDRREVVADLDEVDRALVSADMFDDNNAELKRLRRYENTLHTRIRWFMNQMHDPTPYVKINRDFKPNYVDKPEPAAGPEAPEVEPSKAEIHPPFDLEPDEIPAPGEEVNIPKIVTDRRAKKIEKAQSRREAKRRKVEKLRA